ncbi:MAG TPA: hypothetical protein QGI71_03215 [Dehalococcoidia bacterium]|jgi:hypothetical protein|nr:hypothetical protein [Dehalococcoidia bacterium]
MAINPLRLIRLFFRGNEPDVLAAAARPHDPADYARPELDGSGLATADFPLGKTAPGATLDVWAARVMDGCTEPLAPGVPDLRGVWEVYEGRMKSHVERIEQAGNRISITTGGLVHDMYCDGTLENGVDDIGGFGGDRIRVAATYEHGVHKLRPWDKGVVAVARRLEGDEMRWRYGPFRNKLRRLTQPPLDHPATAAAAEAQRG